MARGGEDVADRRVLLGRVGVDSGQLVIVDPCYIGSALTADHYDRICEVTTNTPHQGGSIPYEGGHEGLAVAFSSGIGDGVYDVYATIGDVPEWGVSGSRRSRSSSSTISNYARPRNCSTSRTRKGRRRGPLGMWPKRF